MFSKQARGVIGFLLAAAIAQPAGVLAMAPQAVPAQFKEFASAYPANVLRAEMTNEPRNEESESQWRRLLRQKGDLLFCIQNLANSLAQAQAEMEQARQDLQTLRSEQDSYQIRLDETRSELEKAVSDYERILQEKDEALRQRDNAENELEQAQFAKDQADREALDTPEVQQAQAGYDAAKAVFDQGSAGFFRPLAGQGDEDADLAEKIITAKGTEYQDGWNRSIDISGFTFLGREDDATNLENMKTAVDHLGDVNEYRRKENAGLQDLKVTSSLMAISQWNANYCTENWSHAQSFATGENVAWGYDNPFEPWYDEEKEMYEGGNHIFHEVGHYLNIVNTNYVAMGYAYTPGRRYTNEYLQEFGETPSKYSKGGVSVSEYQQKFYMYYTSVKAALSDAQAKLDSALKAAYDPNAPLTQNQQEANQQLQNAQIRKDEAAAAYEEKNSELRSASSRRSQASILIMRLEETIGIRSDQMEEKAESISKLEAQINELELLKADAERNLNLCLEELNDFCETEPLPATEDQIQSISSLLEDIAFDSADEFIGGLEDLEGLTVLARELLEDPGSQKEAQAVLSMLHESWLDARKVLVSEIDI